MITLPPPSTPPALITQSSAFYQDVQYGSHSSAFLDFYEPQGTRPVGGWPWLLATHGGSFISGDKDWITGFAYDDIINDLLANGVAVISVNYELLDTPYDDQGLFKCFVSFYKALLIVKANADVFNIDKDRVVYFGTSAGAFMSQFFSLKEWANIPNLGIFSESTQCLGVVAAEPNATLDLFRMQAMGIWTPGETVTDVLNNSATFAENCEAWFSVNGSVTTANDLINDKSLRIMWHCDPFARQLFNSSMAPLLTISLGEYEFPTEITGYIHNPYIPGILQGIYQDYGVECETLGVAATNPVPTTLVGTPEEWIKSKFSII